MKLFAIGFAILLPLAWWSMYAVNRWRVSIPVLGLIDESAEKAGFFPVPTRTPPQDQHGKRKEAPAPAPARPEMPLMLDPEPAVAARASATPM